MFNVFHERHRDPSLRDGGVGGGGAANSSSLSLRSSSNGAAHRVVNGMVLKKVNAKVCTRRYSDVQKEKEEAVAKASGHGHSVGAGEGSNAKAASRASEASSRLTPPYVATSSQALRLDPFVGWDHVEEGTMSHALPTASPSTARELGTAALASVTTSKSGGFSSDDLAVLVYESRLTLKRLQTERREKAAQLEATRKTIAALRGEEARTHLEYEECSDALMHYLHEACDGSTSIRELSALEALVVLRLEQDELTMVNLSEALAALQAQSSAAIEKLREARREAEGRRDYYLSQNAQSTLQGIRMRQQLSALEAEMKILSLRVNESFLTHGRKLFRSSVHQK